MQQKDEEVDYQQRLKTELEEKMEIKEREFDENRVGWELRNKELEKEIEFMRGEQN